MDFAVSDLEAVKTQLWQLFCIVSEIWAGFFIFSFKLLESRGKEKRPSFFSFPTLNPTQTGHASSLLRSKLLIRQGTCQVLLKRKISLAYILMY